MSNEYIFLDFDLSNKDSALAYSIYEGNLLQMEAQKQVITNIKQNQPYEIFKAIAEIVLMVKSGYKIVSHNLSAEHMYIKNLAKINLKPPVKAPFLAKGFVDELNREIKEKEDDFGYFIDLEDFRKTIEKNIAPNSKSAKADLRKIIGGIDSINIAKYKLVKDKKYLDKYIEYLLKNEKVRFNINTSNLKMVYSPSLKLEDLKTFLGIEGESHLAENDVKAMIFMIESFLSGTKNIKNIEDSFYGDKTSNELNKKFSNIKIDENHLKKYGYIIPVDKKKVIPSKISPEKKELLQNFFDHPHVNNFLPPVKIPNISRSSSLKLQVSNFYKLFNIGLDEVTNSDGSVDIGKIYSKLQTYFSKNVNMKNIIERYSTYKSVDIKISSQIMQKKTDKESIQSARRVIKFDEGFQREMVSQRKKILTKSTIMSQIIEQEIFKLKDEEKEIRKAIKEQEKDLPKDSKTKTSKKTVDLIKKLDRVKKQIELKTKDLSKEEKIKKILSMYKTSMIDEGSEIIDYMMKGDISSAVNTFTEMLFKRGYLDEKAQPLRNLDNSYKDLYIDLYTYDKHYKGKLIDDAIIKNHKEKMSIPKLNLEVFMNSRLTVVRNSPQILEAWSKVLTPLMFLNEAYLKEFVNSLGNYLKNTYAQIIKNEGMERDVGGKLYKIQEIILTRKLKSKDVDSLMATIREKCENDYKKLKENLSNISLNIDHMEAITSKADALTREDFGTAVLERDIKDKKDKGDWIEQRVRFLMEFSKKGTAASTSYNAAWIQASFEYKIVKNSNFLFVSEGADGLTRMTDNVDDFSYGIDGFFLSKKSMGISRRHKKPPQKTNGIGWYYHNSEREGTFLMVTFSRRAGVSESYIYKNVSRSKYLEFLSKVSSNSSIGAAVWDLFRTEERSPLNAKEAYGMFEKGGKKKRDSKIPYVNVTTGDLKTVRNLIHRTLKSEARYAISMSEEISRKRERVMSKDTVSDIKGNFDKAHEEALSKKIAKEMLKTLS